MKPISGSSNRYSIKKEVFLSPGYVYLPITDKIVDLKDQFLHSARSYDDNRRSLCEF